MTTCLNLCSHKSILRACPKCQVHAFNWCMKTGGPAIDSDVGEFMLERMTAFPVRRSFIMSYHSESDVIYHHKEIAGLDDIMFMFEGTEEEFAGFLCGLMHFHGVFTNDVIFDDADLDNLFLKRVMSDDLIEEALDKFPYVLSIPGLYRLELGVELYGVKNKEEFVWGFTRAMNSFDMYTRRVIDVKTKEWAVMLLGITLFIKSGSSIEETKPPVIHTGMQLQHFLLGECNADVPPW